jgi:hypothetical protein
VKANNQGSQKVKNTNIILLDLAGLHNFPPFRCNNRRSILTNLEPHLMITTISHVVENKQIEALLGLQRIFQGGL